MCIRQYSYEPPKLVLTPEQELALEELKVQFPKAKKQTLIKRLFNLK